MPTTENAQTENHFYNQNPELNNQGNVVMKNVGTRVQGTKILPTAS